MSKPARARRLDRQVPLRATRMGVGQQESRPTITKEVKPPAQLTALREKIRPENSVKNDNARARTANVQKTLEIIRTKFGEDAYRESVADFKADFREFDKINLMRNKGPGVQPKDHLQPPP